MITAVLPNVGSKRATALASVQHLKRTVQISPTQRTTHENCIRRRSTICNVARSMRGYTHALLYLPRTGASLRWITSHWCELVGKKKFWFTTTHLFVRRLRCGEPCSVHSIVDLIHTRFRVGRYIRNGAEEDTNQVQPRNRAMIFKFAGLRRWPL